MTTLNIILNFAANAKQIGDPYGPITMRMFRSAQREIDIYNRNRETLYDLSHTELRARLHTLILRITMSIEGVSDTTATIATLEPQLEAPDLRAEDRARIEARIAALKESRESAYAFIGENAVQLKAVIKELEPIARFSYDAVEKAVRNA